MIKRCSQVGGAAVVWLLIAVTAVFGSTILANVNAAGRPDLVGAISCLGDTIYVNVTAQGQADDGDPANPSKYYSQTNFDNEYFALEIGGKYLKYNMFGGNTTPGWGTNWGNATAPLPAGVSFSQTTSGDDFVYSISIAYSELGVGPGDSLTAQITARDFNDDYVQSYSGYVGFDGLYSQYRGLWITSTGALPLSLPKASATVELSDLVHTYDGTPKSATVATDPAGLAVVVTYDGFPTPPTDAGSCTVLAVVIDPGYEGSATDTLTIEKADPAITVNGGTWVYDGNAHGATGTATGVKGEDLSGDLDLGASFTNVPGGTANWTFTDTTGNYHDASGSVDIDITQGSLTITGNDDAKVYDAVAYTDGNGVAYAGFVGGEDETVLGGALTYSGTSQGAVNVGTYVITPGGLTSTNYAITFVDGELEITPAPLTITADDQSKRFDEQPFTDFTATYRGFVAGQGPGVLGGSLGFTGDAVGAIDPGRYTITPGGLTSPNYAIVFEDGTLEIRPYYEVAPIEGALGFIDQEIAGGGGAYGDEVIAAIYETGQPIILTFEIAGFGGEEVTDAIAVVVLIDVETEPVSLVYLGLARYDEEWGSYYLEIATDKLTPGFYLVDVTLNDGSHFQELIELVEPEVTEPM